MKRWFAEKWLSLFFKQQFDFVFGKVTVVDADIAEGAFLAIVIIGFVATGDDDRRLVFCFADRFVGVRSIETERKARLWS